MPELRVGVAVGQHKAEGLGFTTSFYTDSTVMNGHNCVVGCVWFRVESNRPRERLEREGKARSGVGEQEVGAFSAPRRAPLQ